MKYAVKSMNQFLDNGHNGVMLYDNIKDASKAAKDTAEAICFMLSEENHKPYALDERTKVFADVPNVVVPLITINELDQNGHVYTSVDQVTVVNGEWAQREIEEYREVQKKVAVGFVKIKKSFEERTKQQKENHVQAWFIFLLDCEREVFYN